MGYGAEITFHSKHLLQSVIMHYHIYDQRKSQLEDLKDSFRSTGILKFLSARPYLWESAFPRMSSLNYTAVEVLSAITFEGADVERVKGVFLRFLEQLENG